ncbi:LysR family transcriptional regulator [Vibrio sp. D404a]|uniref:LysR family transcriptional regulator n=1 Tax=unclassified Vibrio TaxID=2614977 RepID=UPI0025538970|nr:MULTISPECIES: LysR family transcriptional regulator [unclassified Vibrio]MDK9736205.1 LysR family transcriptional regulator [Vibrio sp. D404a]MDK9797298.1 LysR family transcriptional regulator [Vibrio sp. D449a]
MAKDLFGTLDLNLLRTFLIVHQEKNTRKAAERLFVSQPAVSQALQKLRHHFDDELFVKVHGGLQATYFAESLANEITPHLDGLAVALNTANAFDPSQITSNIRIALSPVTMACLCGPLYQEIKRQAPNAKLELIGWSTTTPEEIRKDSIHLGVNYLLENSSKEVYTRKVLDLTGCIFVRKDHPIKKTVITPVDMAGYDIASLISPGWNDNFSYASRLLEKYDIEHSIGFRSEMLMAVIDIIQHTDMYMPHSNLFPVENYPNLRAVKVLVEGKEYHYPLFTHIHSKNKNNPLHGWLTNIVEEALQHQVNKHGLLFK